MTGRCAAWLPATAVVFNVTHVPFLKRGALWNAVFILVNGYMTTILLMERNKEVHFTREEVRGHDFFLSSNMSDGSTV